MSQMSLNWNKANEKAINKALQEMVKVNEEKAFFALGLIGEKVSNLARKDKTYQDQTANLRNSTGYIIVTDKSIQDKEFGEGEGAKIGLKTAIDNITTNKEEIQLIVLAGMNYAEELETKGYKVLSFAVLSIPEMAKEIQNYYNK